ncbi:MAG: hypothetical protein LBU89_09445 [Fibromonadaceae bacterium]|jgi:uncharacterized Zn finger protein (UPF0148 family)|nr:hypothetical protein [Fibromonadaceae bacterium]
MSNVEMVCPCCDNVLVVDTLAKEIVAHRERKKKASLEEFLEQEKNKPAELEKKMAEAREKEKNRSEYLRKKFEEAKNNKELKDPAPNIMWD